MTHAREWLAQFRNIIRLLPWSLNLLWESHKGATIGVALLTLVQAIIPISQLWITKLIIDQMVYVLGLPVEARVGDPTNLALWYVGAEAGLLLLGLVVGLGSGHIRNILQEHLVYHVQLKVLNQAARLDLASYESAQYYDQLRRVQQESMYGPIQLLSALLRLGQALITLISVVALILFYQPWIVLLLFLTTLPSFWALLEYGNKRFMLFNNRTPEGRRAEYLSALLSQGGAAKEIRVWGIVPYIMEQITKLRGHFREENLSLSRGQAVVSLWGEALASLGYYIAYATVIFNAVAGRLTLGDLTLYASLFSRAQALFDEILRSVAEVYEVQLFVENLVVFLAIEPVVVAPPNPQPAPALRHALEVRNLTFTYPNTTQAVLDDISFTIQPGECVAVVGVNGAGKTTLVKCLLRLYDPISGAVLADGVDLKQLDPHDWRQKVGVVFQDYVPYQLSARENIGFGSIDKLDNLPAIRAVAEQVEMDGLLANLPNGYETTLGRQFEGGRELSGGQWQRLAVARALLRDAPLLILDEPTAAIDAQVEYELFQQFKALARGRMTLLISHRFSTVRMADRILVLEEGKIIENGSHAALLAQGGRYAHLFNIQAEGYQLNGTAV